MSTQEAVSLALAQPDNGVYEVQVSGRIGRGVDERIKTLLRETSGQEAATQAVVLNLADVAFLDSAGISSLLALQHDLTEAGGKMVLCSVPPRINQMFELVGMARVIPVADDARRAREMCHA
ncbi:MAG TPA: STAS domain-containing protein [Phycisphaerae bacterium]|nr:STAS domain-containing protein [Phycisphaerae bacterium]HNU46633.1 STAS domain-containing protein [Phycisphaerae bacterium]